MSSILVRVTDAKAHNEARQLISQTVNANYRSLCTWVFIMHYTPPQVIKSKCYAYDSYHQFLCQTGQSFYYRPCRTSVCCKASGNALPQASKANQKVAQWNSITTMSNPPTAFQCFVPIFILISTCCMSLFLLIPPPASPGFLHHIYLICRLKNVMLPYQSTGGIRSEVCEFMLFSHGLLDMTKLFLAF